MKKFTNAISLAIMSLLPSYVFALDAYDAPKVEINDPSTTSVKEILGLVIAWVLLLVGGLAILFLIWGGLQYITSAGNKDRAEQAKKTITYAVIGLIVIVLARVIVSLVTGLPKSFNITG